MLNDPFEVPRPYVPKPQPYDFRSEFWRQAPDMRPTEGQGHPGTVKVCRYLNGRHEMPPKPWCAHYDREDETGKRVRPDWTVQDDG